MLQGTLKLYSITAKEVLDLFFFSWGEEMSLQYDKILPKGKLLGRLTEKQKSCVYFYDAHRTSEKVKTEGNKY